MTHESHSFHGRIIDALMAGTALGGALLLVSGAVAQTAPPVQSAAAEGIEEIVVEGQKVTREMSNIAVDMAKYGTQVQVIDDFEIDTGGFTNFGELASGLIRGANIGYSPDEGEFTIRIDGGSDRDTLLLLDGSPTFDRGTPLEDLWGATAIDPRMIESVEIFRGGQSLYYGGNGGLGVVAVKYKQPDGTTKGEFGTYLGSFKTREVYGNTSFPIDSAGDHSVMLYGRSYETDAHKIFDKSAYNDTVLELGGMHEFPYSYNLIGAKYLWKMGDETELRLGAELATIDFRDSFPNDHIFNPNYTDYPKYLASFQSQVTDRLNVEAEAYYSEPKLKNTEVDAQICRIPQSVLNPATGRPFTRASDYEAFAAANNLPIGCITNPDLSTKADRVSRAGFYVDSQGRVKGTLQNPFRIGDPMGFVIQTVANFGTGVPVKGFGDGTQFTAGYVDYGINARAKYMLTDWLEVVGGVQRTTSYDASNEVYGVSDKKLNSTGVYGDLRFDLPFLGGTAMSVAGRQDFNNQFDDSFIWKFSLRQEFGGGYYVRASGGTSYNNPRAQEVGFFANTVNNPSLGTQEVETYGAGAGINGEVGDGTFNVEVGYFDTEISNLFGNAQIRDVCPGVDPTRVINPNIITPEEFCANFRNFGLTPLSTATFNTRAIQDIKGYTFDASLDLEQITVDLSFTKQDSLEPNPLFGLTAVRDVTGAALTTVVPGKAGSERFRQSGERPEWMASALVTYMPTDRWILSVNPRWQGDEFLYVQNNAARIVDAAGNRTNPDQNFGDYMVVNASIQYFMGAENEHRWMLRIVNLFDKKYFERGGATDRAFARAAVRGELLPTNSQYYYTYGWNGKPLSFYLQYEYNF
ncbi:MAG: TonB-dependent receptor plug domain-containing protein [Rhodospirillaceae bacterium]|nr:TonB-dependent receptor plug domain-containing protein [Rhodospirillaceae bacterium]